MVYGSPSHLSISAYALSVQVATKYVQEAAALARHLRFSAAVVGRISAATAAPPPVVATVAGVTSTSPYSNCSTVSAVVLVLSLISASRNPFELVSASVLPSHERYLTSSPSNANARTVVPNLSRIQTFRPPSCLRYKLTVYKRVK